METYYQEPCCIERTLPMLLRKNNGLLPFQTNGDVTVEKLLKAVSHLAGNTLDIIVATPAIDIPTLRLFRWYYERGWLHSLTVLTQTDQTDFIKNELPAELALTVLSSDRIADGTGMLIINGETQTVIVQGPLLSKPTKAQLQYIAYMGKDTSRIAQFTATTTSIIRVATKKKAKKKKQEQPEPSDKSEHSETSETL